MAKSPKEKKKKRRNLNCNDDDDDDDDEQKMFSDAQTKKNTPYTFYIQIQRASE